MMTPLLMMEYAAAVLVVPLAAASVYYAVKRWRTRAISVNCHFCNENSYVPATHWNAFYCPHCDQYNGFTKDGDYNRLEPEMYREPMTPIRYATTDEDYKQRYGGVQLCPMCTSRTAQKQLCIARFEPSNEETYDLELTNYKKRLERIFALCARCELLVERHLRSETIKLRNKYAKELSLHRRMADVNESDLRLRYRHLRI